MTTYSAGMPVSVLTVSTDMGTLFRSTMKALAGGGYILIYQETGPTQFTGQTADGVIYGQIFDAAGNKSGGPFTITPDDGLYHEMLNSNTSVVATDDGGFIVSWGDGSNTSSPVAEQRFDATGARVGMVTHTDAQLTQLPDGRFAGALFEADGENSNIGYQLYDSSLQPIGDQAQVNDGGAYFRYVEGLTPLKDGGFAIAWNSHGQAGSSNDIYEQLFDSTGAKIGDETLVSTNTDGDEFSARIIPLADGGYVVAWWDLIPSNFFTSQAVFQRFDATGQKVGPIVQVSDAANGGSTPEIAALSDGGFVVVYSGYDSSYIQHEYVQRFDATGAKSGAELQLANAGTPFSVIGLENGGYVISWQIYNVSTGKTDVFQQTFSPPPVFTGDDLANTLAGTSGADEMHGLGGNDTYIVNNAGDTAVENANEGIDTVQASVSFMLGANVENLTLTGSAVTGTGNALDNLIIGNAGNNKLDGKAGADRMLGGAGDDTYVIDDAGDRAVESHNGTTDDGGKDTVQSYVSFHLGAFIENLTLIGGAMVNATGNELDNVLTGNSNDNVINGGLGADTMMGGKGNDTYFVDNANDVVIENVNEGTKDKVISSIAYALTDNVENLTVTGTGDFTVTGNILNNILVGNSGNNLVDGSGGGDHMFGGAGNDTYIVDNDNDRVSEQLDGTHDDGGTDTVMASVTYHIFSFVENLTLTGTGNINATGNQWNNVLVGNSGNNVLNGQIGADTMSGGLGDDGYIVDNSGDVVIENANEGTDKVLSSVSYTLTNNVENLTLMGTANLNATGNSLDNILQGNAGNNRIDGGQGNDRLFGGAGADTFVFSANSGADIIKDFSVSDNDRIDVSAWTHGAADLTLIHTVGGNTVIDFGSGNTVTVAATAQADVISHLIW